MYMSCSILVVFCAVMIAASPVQDQSSCKLHFLPQTPPLTFALNSLQQIETKIKTWMSLSTPSTTSTPPS